MKVTPFIIEKFAKFMVGNVNFENLKTLVSTIDSVDISGEAKRQKVIDTFKHYSFVLSSFLLNLGIELAVAWLKSREGKL